MNKRWVVAVALVGIFAGCHHDKALGGCPDKDGDGYACDDCDDDNPAIHPGATEICDGIDNNCNGEIDEGVEHTYYEDLDHDGYGNDESMISSCTPIAGEVTVGGDCNDNDPTVNPGRAEICDYKDNNCNGQIDENGTTRYYVDSDGDGYGAIDNYLDTCGQPGGFVAVGGDCDDSRPDVHPGATEDCNARDDDCDGIIDGETRSCDNTCGAGLETCTAGLFGGCTAPVVTTLNTSTALTGASTLAYQCLRVTARVTISADTELHAANWIHVEQNGDLEAGARLSLVTGGDVSFTGNGTLIAPEVSITAGGTVHLDQDARVTLRNYSGAGNAACSDGSPQTSSGGAGGARGGSGGKGGSCGALSTQPIAGAGGSGAENGADGCSCSCSAATVGGGVSGGGGGAAMAGGGGGNGGAGGNGASGQFQGASFSSGAGGGVEPTTGEPTFGGAGGGGSGTALASYAPEACQSKGGNGGGLLHVTAIQFENLGLIAADGAAGASEAGATGAAGGGGGGAGGTLVIHSGTFNNLGSLSAVGGAGGTAGGPCDGAHVIGGGGGGGGGRVYVTGTTSGVPAVLTTVGNILTGGGLSGLGACSGVPGTSGGDGIVTTNP